MISPYPFTGYLSPTGLSPATNGLVGGVVPGEQGDGFPLFIEPASASSIMSKFGLDIVNGYLAIGTPEGLGQAKVKQVLDVPELGISGVVESIKTYAGLGDWNTVEIAVSQRGKRGA